MPARFSSERRSRAQRAVGWLAWGLAVAIPLALIMMVANAASSFAAGVAFGTLFGLLPAFLFGALGRLCLKLNLS